MSAMPGFWRKCRLAFRCVRFTVWGLVLLLLLAFAWFNTIGLPDFLKTRLVTALHDRGVQLEFSRMRLRLAHGLVCDNVRVGTGQGTPDSVLAAREVQLRINYPALLHFRLQVDGLVVRNGRLSLAVAPGNWLAVTNLQGQLRILPEDTWSLDEFTGVFAGVTFKLAGEVAHAPECRNWKMFAGAKTAGRGGAPSSLQNFSDALNQIHFRGKPEVNARLDGDARDVHSFALRVSGRAPNVDTPWCSGRDLEFAVRVSAPTNAPPAADPAWDFWTNLQPFRIQWLARAIDLKSATLNLEAIDSAGEWSAPNLALNKCALKLAQGNLDVTAKLDIARPEVTFTADSAFDFHALSKVLPAKVRAGLRQVTWTGYPKLGVNGSLAVPAWTNHGAAWSENLESRLRLRGDLAVTNLLLAGRVPFDSVRSRFNYSDGTWNLLDLELSRGRTALEVSATETESNGDFHLVVGGKLDADMVRPLLATTNAIQSFGLLTFRQPVSLVLEAAGNLRESTLRLRGDLAVTNLLLAGRVPLDSVRSRFNYSDGTWNLLDLELSRGRTVLEVSGAETESNEDFHCVVGGKLDADMVQPFLATTNAVQGFGVLTFRQPVALTLEAAGNLRDFSSLTATGRVVATDFAIRGQWEDSLVTTLSYTNLIVDFYHPVLVRSDGAEQFSADKATLDLSGQRLFLRGGQGHVLPAAVGEAIGPQTAAIMEPYHFLAIPSATVEGCIPLKFRDGNLVTADADLEFHVLGNVPFGWRKFQTPAITGTIHWLGHNLILTNVVADCYSGTAHGWAVFDVETPGDGTDFSFFMQGTNVDFNAMGRALWSPTNELRGSLSGQLRVTSANSSDWRTWNGYGQAQLLNGLLWDAPVLGSMSSVLHKLTPRLDLGNSRATEGTGGFTVTNGVIFTDSLEIRSLTMRFDYVGTVDLQENVSARAKAQLLRNTPVIGEFFSTLLSPVSKALECEVTGTLDQPKIRLLYNPFHPIRTMEKIFSPSTTDIPAKP